MSDVIRVLSIDGGGIRGIIPALVLHEIEKRKKKPIAQMFDLIAGTSTGGILALGLTVPDGNQQPKFSAAALAQLYEKEGRRIFDLKLFRKIITMGGLRDEKFPSSGIEGLLQEYFGETRLKDALTPVLITAYEIERRMPWFFRSWRAREDSDYDFPMWVVGRSTSAAPTYFEPMKVEVGGLINYYALVDGGVFANNPAMAAWVDARAMFPGKEIVVISLGTGELTRPYYHHQAKNWGLAQWAQPVLGIMFDGVGRVTEYQLSKLLPFVNGKSAYHRLQVTLTPGHDDMDNAEPLNIQGLKLLAENMIRQEDRRIDEICSLLP